MTFDISISREARDQLMKSASASNLGGFQQLLLRLQAGVYPDTSGYRLKISRSDAERVVHYCSEKYGSGGYQGRIILILPAVEAELGQLPPPTPSLFEEFEPAHA